MGRFVEDFRAHGGSTENVGVITCDMSLGFRKGILENFPEAHTIIDKFHVVKHCNEAVGKVRKEEAKTNELLRRTKYIWLKNEKNLTENQREKKTALCRKHLRTAGAYCMRIALQEIYETCMDKEHADERLRRLCSWMTHSRLEPMKEFAWLVRRHSEEILTIRLNMALAKSRPIPMEFVVTVFGIQLVPLSQFLDNIIQQLEVQAAFLARL